LDESAEFAFAINNLAIANYHRGRHAESRSLHERALAIRERELGPDDPSVGSSLNNLATVHFAMGQYTDAERLFARALAISERYFGSDHHLVATSLNNLAMVHGSRGRYSQARALHERALAIREPPSRLASTSSTRSPSRSSYSTPTTRN
jgi:tetratricopeptide (TPR) repeat protein